MHSPYPQNLLLFVLGSHLFSIRTFIVMRQKKPKQEEEKKKTPDQVAIANPTYILTIMVNILLSSFLGNILGLSLTDLALNLLEATHNDLDEMMEWKERRETQVLLGSYSIYGLSVGTHVEIRRPLCSQSSLHLWVWGIKFRVRSLHSKGLYPLGPLASPWVYTWIANVVLTLLPLGHVWYWTMASPDDISWLIHVSCTEGIQSTRRKRDVQAVRAQIQGLMVPHVLLPLHTNTVSDL